LSPLGLSPGLLYSVISHLKIELSKIWVVTSSAAGRTLDEILGETGWEGEHDCYLVEDPFTRFNEGKLIYYCVLPDALEASRIVVNITGGSTALQFAVQDAARRLRGIECSTGDHGLGRPAFGGRTAGRPVLFGGGHLAKRVMMGQTERMQ